jgi:hypothetical protein
VASQFRNPSLSGVAGSAKIDGFWCGFSSPLHRILLPLLFQTSRIFFPVLFFIAKTLAGMYVCCYYYSCCCCCCCCCRVGFSDFFLNGKKELSAFNLFWKYLEKLHVPHVKDLSKHSILVYRQFVSCSSVCGEFLSSVILLLRHGVRLCFSSEIQYTRFFFLVWGPSLEGSFILLLIAGHRMLLKFTCTQEIGQRKVEKRKNK